MKQQDMQSEFQERTDTRKREIPFVTLSALGVLTEPPLELRDGRSLSSEYAKTA